MKSYALHVTDLAIADKHPQLLPIIAEMEIRYRNASVVTGVHDA